MLPYPTFQGRELTGLSKAEFAEDLKLKLGLILSPEEVDKLFEKYDSDGNGRIEFHEFVMHLMPKGNGDCAWYKNSMANFKRHYDDQKVSKYLVNNCKTHLSLI